MSETCEELEAQQGAFVRRIGQALPEVKFAVQGRVRRFALPRPAEVLNLYSWQDRAERPRHFVVAVLAITREEAFELSRTSSDFNTRQRAAARAQPAPEAPRGDTMRTLKKLAAVAVLAAAALLLLSAPAGATTIATVETPPAQVLQTVLGILPEVPIVLAAELEGLVFTLTIEPIEGALVEFPVEVFLAVGPDSAIEFSTVPEPAPLVLFSLGLAILAVLGHSRLEPTIPLGRLG